jgi:plastocyanin
VGGNIVSIRVTNHGGNTITNLAVSYEYGSSGVVQENLTVSLNPGDTVDYTFNQPGPAVTGSTLLCGQTLLPNDMVPSNDKLCKAVTAVGDVSYDEFVLYQNTPNPFNGTTRISYTVPRAGDVQFRVTSMMGVVVFSEVHKNVNGTFEKNYNFSFLNPGIYYYSIIYEGKMLTRKMIIQ